MANWLEGIRQAPTSAPGFTPRVYTDPATGRVYTESLSGGTRTESYEIPGQVVGYVGTDGGPWFPGKKAQVYDTSGVQTGEFDVADFNARDLGEMLALGIIAAIATAGAYQAFAGVGAGGGGAAATTTQAGPTLSKAALDGTTAFGANSVPGAYELATVASSGVAAPVAQVAATSTGGASLSSLASAGVSAVKTALGLGTAVLGARAAAGGTGTGTGTGANYAPGVGTGANYAPGVGEPFPSAGGGGVSPALALGGLFLVGMAVYFGFKKG